MADLSMDPAVIKLIEYARAKKSLSYDEMNELLPNSIVNSEKIEEVIMLLEKNNIRLEDEEAGLDDFDEETEHAEEAEKVTSKKKLVYSEKDTTVDDPIRLYLREIGKENLLTAEQEVELSKQMEEGEEIINSVIKGSGLIIYEVYLLAQKVFSKVEPKELDLSKRRFLNFYRKETADSDIQEP